MQFLQNALVFLGAVLPLIAAAPIENIEAKREVSTQIYSACMHLNSTQVIPGKYIITYKPGTNLAEHTNWVTSIHKRNLAKRDDGSAGITASYRVFNGYAGEFDEATIKEIEASADVSQPSTIRCPLLTT